VTNTLISQPRKNENQLMWIPQEFLNIGWSLKEGLPYQPWAAAIGGLAVGGILWWPMWVHLDRSWDSARAVARQKGLVI
jgi:hypothetical protein